MPERVVNLTWWITAAAAVLLIGLALSLRGEQSQLSSQPSPDVPASIVAVGGQFVAPQVTPRPILPAPAPDPTSVPAPTLTPVPPPPPTQQVTVAPVAAATPPNGGAGGPLAPRTAPPGWTPPERDPGDVWTIGTLGQTLSAGGITVTATRMPVGSPPSCFPNGTDPGYVGAGFWVTTTWSGFTLPVFGISAPANAGSTCWTGPHPFESGATYEFFVQVPPEVAATTLMRMGYFPNGASPAYIFEFR